MKVVDNTQPRLIHAEDLRLMPGKNPLDDAKARLWEQAKKNDVVQHMLREKHLVEEGFDESDTAEVVRMVSETVDYEVLEAMKEREKRPEVLLAIQKQLDKLGPTAEQKKQLDEQAERDRKARSQADAEARGEAAKKAPKG